MPLPGITEPVVTGEGGVGTTRQVTMTPDLEQWLRDIAAQKINSMTIMLQQYEADRQILQTTLNVAAYFGLSIEV